MDQHDSLLDKKTYRKAIDGFSAALTGLYADHVGFLRARAGLSEKRDGILREYRDSGANLFSPLFKYRLENFHSELLGMILDPAVPETGDSRYVNQFLACLRAIKPELRARVFTGQARVEREAGEKREDGRIDILIHEGEYGIIIENKLNNAPDQPNQLARYLHAAGGMGKEIIAVVYIPPLNKAGGPPLEDYDEPWKGYVPELREKLVILPAAARDNRDLVHGFLEPCLALPGNNENQRYLLSQYAKLLRTLTGAETMTKEVDMALLAECYRDKNSITIMENLAEVWNNRGYLLSGILRDTARERLVGELGYEADQDNEAALGLYKRIDDRFNLYFFSHAEHYLFEIGFRLKSPIKPSVREQLWECLNTAAPEGYFTSDKTWGDDFILKWFNIDEYKEPLQRIADYLVERYRLLEEKTRKALGA